MALTIQQLASPQGDNFSYLVSCGQTGQAMAVDPSFSPQTLLDAAEEAGVRIVVLANTHGHADHIAGNPEILKRTGARLAAHPDDVADAKELLEEGKVLRIGAGTVTVMHTPGHTPGSVVLRLDDAIITGDTLFVSRCGRADLPGSDVEALYESLQRIKQLPAETRVYPGHDYGPTPVSTLAWELENNEFLRCPDLESFIRLRMG